MNSGMRAKTIKSILRKKIDDWLATIEDKDLRAQVAKNVIVTGGCIVSMLLGEKISDFDVYLRTHSTALKLAHYYVHRFKSERKNGIDVPIRVVEDGDRIKIVAQSAGIVSEEGTEKPYQYFEGRPEGEAGAYVGEVIDNPEQIENTYEETLEKALETPDEEGKPKYRAVFITTNAITLANKVQVIIRFHGEPEEIHKYYDYVHCTCYWTSWDSELVLRPAALEAMLARELKYVGSKYPICSLIRMRKFIQRGWKINAGQILKIVMQIGELDLTDFKVLEDQLTGVDTAYFVELLAKVAEKDPEKINAAYLVEILDRIF
jgi:hypothetical protein